MSYKLDMPQVGDIIVQNCYSFWCDDQEEETGKFLVVGKDSSEANKNKDLDNTLITLHVIHQTSDYGRKVGSNFIISYGDMKRALSPYKHYYHYSGKEGV